jgi:hypothetical protein
VRAWERGEREPEGATLRLLELAEKHPEVLAEAVEKKGTHLTTAHNPARR